jgi:hypothetical protein
MKCVAILIAVVASTQAFAPAPAGRASTAVSESIFSRISNMDLFAPQKTQNDYGARGGKASTNIGKLSAKSYVPSGLTKEQYEKARAAEQTKKNERYAKNVKKAGVFQDYTAFYIKRGTDTTDAWSKSVTKGHDMAKTKFDWSGATDTNKNSDAGVKKAVKGRGKK